MAVFVSVSPLRRDGWPTSQCEEDMRALIAGNWKMNGLLRQLVEIDTVAASVSATPPHADILICPPATLIARAAEQVAGRIAIGGQNCHSKISGAFTGDISADMLKDAGASTVIVGHSERRRGHGETDAIVAEKAKAAWRAGLLTIVCVGETKSQREAGIALSVCGTQISGSVPRQMVSLHNAVAYEPLWAIGSGQVPTASQITEMHAHIRWCLVEHLGEQGKEVRILYGGSVKPANARAILALPEVNGALIGGASLRAADFLEIIDGVPHCP